MQNILLRELILYIDGNKSRLKCLASMIMSLMTGSSVYLKGLSLGINGNAKAPSKTHRAYRFFRDFTFDYMQVVKLILSLFHDTDYIMAMDRTNWKFGKSDINILFLSIVIGKISVPIYWKALSHGGSCSAEFMQEFLAQFIKSFGVDKIKYLLADREFMNFEWLNFLFAKQINFVIPLKKDNKIRLANGFKILSVSKMFKSMQPLEYKVCQGILWDKKVTFSAYKNDQGELMVLVSPITTEMNVFALYKYRWSIERLFKHLKTGGFDIEKSHLVMSERFEKLLVVASIAAALIIKNGLIQNQLKPIQVKQYKTVERQLFSLFTYGFDHIKSIFYRSIAALSKLIRTILTTKNILLTPNLNVYL